jgi:ABC transport system ATP-binding/permease protein
VAQPLLLTVQNAAVSFGEKTLFDDLSFTICEGDRICLVGRNGAGKTTLINIITGAFEMDSGKRWQLQGTVIGHLRQEATFKPGQTVGDYVFEGLLAENQSEEQAYKIEQVIEPLHLNITDRMEKLSGGQLRRADLARALVENPDILLLDEPTNHLDLEIIEWLENYLKHYRGAVVCISHDKAFLSGMSDRVFWLDRGSLKICPKGFAHFEAWSEALLEQESRTLHNRQKLLDQEVDWASRGVKARRKRNVRRLDLMKQERDKLKTDKRALAKMLARIEWTPVESDPSSHIVAEFYNVHKGFTEDGRSRTILDKFNLRIMRGDRIGIVGRNGSGKTTFLKMLVGELEPDQGKVKRARDMRLSYFDQKRSALKPEQSLWRTLNPDGGDYVQVMGKMRHVCGYLKDFMFDPTMALQPVASLSGGQKNRLMLAKILADPGSLLILDEPTNDLDMDTLEMLEEVLSTYDGTLIVVSHDRDFLDQTVTKILAFEGEGKVEGHIGGYRDYLEAKKAALLPVKSPPSEKPTPSKSNPPPTPDKKPAAKLSYKLQFELEQLPSRIAALETEISTIEDRLSDPDLFDHDPGSFHQLSNRLPLAKQELDAAEERWLELEGM